MKKNRYPDKVFINVLKFLGKDYDIQTTKEIQSEYYDNYYNYVNDENRKTLKLELDDWKLGSSEKV